MNRHRRRTRIRHGLQALEVVAVVGWAPDPGALPDTYNALKAEMVKGYGRRVRGKVTCRGYEGDEARKAIGFLFEVYQGDEPMLAVIRQCAGKVREHGGLVVTCTAKAITDASGR